MIAVPKKPLFLVLLYLRPLSLQTRTRLRKSLKAFLIARSYRLCLRVKIIYQTPFLLKITFPKNLHLVSFINFIAESAMSLLL